MIRILLATLSLLPLGCHAARIKQRKAESVEGELQPEVGNARGKLQLFGIENWVSTYQYVPWFSIFGVLDQKLAMRASWRVVKMEEGEWKAKIEDWSPYPWSQKEEGGYSAYILGAIDNGVIIRETSVKNLPHKYSTWTPSNDHIQYNTQSLPGLGDSNTVPLKWDGFTVLDTTHTNTPGGPKFVLASSGNNNVSVFVVNVEGSGSSTKIAHGHLATINVDEQEEKTWVGVNSYSGFEGEYGSITSDSENVYVLLRNSKQSSHDHDPSKVITELWKVPREPSHGRPTKMTLDPPGSFDVEYVFKPDDSNVLVVIGSPQTRKRGVYKVDLDKFASQNQRDWIPQITEGLIVEDSVTCAAYDNDKMHLYIASTVQSFAGGSTNSFQHCGAISVLDLKHESWTIKEVMSPKGNVSDLVFIRD